jgi:hypothetical protein
MEGIEEVQMSVYEFQGSSAHSRRSERELFIFAKLTEITKWNFIDFIGWKRQVVPLLHD